MNASPAVRTIAVALTAAGALAFAGAPAHAEAAPAPQGSVNTNSLNLDDNPELRNNLGNAYIVSVAAPIVIVGQGLCWLKTALGGTTENGCSFS